MGRTVSIREKFKVKITDKSLIALILSIFVSPVGLGLAIWAKNEEGENPLNRWALIIGILGTIGWVLGIIWYIYWYVVWMLPFYMF